GEPVAGDLDGLAEVAAGIGEGQGGEGADVVDGDELHDQVVVPGHVARAVLEKPVRAGEVLHEAGGTQDRGGGAPAADVLFDLPLLDGTPAVLTVEAVLALGAADGGVHQVTHVGGLGGVNDVRALDELVRVGGLDAIDAVDAAYRRRHGGGVVQVTSDEFGSGRGKRGSGRSRVVTVQGTDVPPVGEQLAGGGAALFPGGSGDHDRLASSVHGGLLLSRFLH